MGKTLHLDCRSGISGDMLVGALLDIGTDTDYLISVLESVPVRGFMIKTGRTEKGGKTCTDFDVVLDEEYENNDHNMEYLHGHSDDAPLAVDGKGIVRITEEENDTDHAGHKHDDLYKHEKEGEKPHLHRNLSDVLEIINGSAASKKAKDLAGKIFSILAQAESEVHDVPIDRVHFHEVGAIDSIVDILAVAVCIDHLNVERVVVSSLYDGCGTVRTRHGVLPVPVPAVSNIALKYRIPLNITDVKGELVTPTGAAATAALCTDKSLPRTYKVIKEGYGSGKRDYDAPCYLKAELIEPDRW